MCSVSVISLTLIGILSYQRSSSLTNGKETQVKGATESLMDKIDRNWFEPCGDAQPFALSESARSGVP